MVATRSALAIALLTSACTHALQGAGGLPLSEIALVDLDKAALDAVDGQDIRDNAQYAVPPGPHLYALHPVTDILGDPKTRGAMELCFVAGAGHHYVLRSNYGLGSWQPGIIDNETGNSVRPGCDEAPVVAPAEDAPVYSVADPRTGLAPSRQFHPGHQPNIGLTLGLGLAFGGAALVETRFSNGENKTLNAGGGFSVLVGASWTPLWIGHAIGFGIAGDVGWKVDSTDATNGSIALRRFPLTASARGVVPLTERWHLTFGAGVAKDQAITISGSGFGADLNADINGLIGPMAEVGLYWAEGRHGAVGGAIRYTGGRYGRAGANVDATSIGFVLTVNFNI